MIMETWDLFKSGGDDIGSVNKYLWQASLEVLSFFPINSADPFTGIIVLAKGKSPGSTEVYDATVYIMTLLLMLVHKHYNKIS